MVNEQMYGTLMLFSAQQNKYYSILVDIRSQKKVASSFKRYFDFMYHFISIMIISTCRIVWHGII